jgi:uncharacterized protein (DUF2267 family)
VNDRQILAAVRERAALKNDGEAARTLKAGVAALSSRLSYAEAHDLTDYLPPRLRSAVIDSLAPNVGLRFRPLEDLYDELAMELGVPLEEAEKRARAVCSVLAEALPAVEVRDLRSQLPRSFAPLFPDAQPSTR